MNKDLLAQALKKAGGRDGFLRWVGSNKRAFFGMFGKEILQDMPPDVQPPREPDPKVFEEFLATIQRTLEGNRRNREAGLDALGRTIPGVATSPGAADPPDTNRPGVHHGLHDTGNGIEETTAPQPRLKQSESPPPKPDVRDNKPARVESIPGLNFVDCSSPYPQSTDANGNPTYGVNWSQSKAY
jgi:hypothetical protein